MNSLNSTQRRIGLRRVGTPLVKDKVPDTTEQQIQTDTPEMKLSARKRKMARLSLSGTKFYQKKKLKFEDPDPGGEQEEVESKEQLETIETKNVTEKDNGTETESEDPLEHPEPVPDEAAVQPETIETKNVTEKDNGTEKESEDPLEHPEPVPDEAAVQPDTTETKNVTEKDNGTETESADPLEHPEPVPDEAAAQPEISELQRNLRVHDNKVKELKDAINQWKTALRRGVEQLRSKAGPALTDEVLQNEFSVRQEWLEDS